MPLEKAGKKDGDPNDALYLQEIQYKGTYEVRWKNEASYLLLGGKLKLDVASPARGQERY